MFTKNIKKEMKGLNKNQNEPEIKPLVKLSEDAILVLEKISHFAYVKLLSLEHEPELFNKFQGKCILDISDLLKREISEPFYHDALFRLGSFQGRKINLLENLFLIMDNLTDDFARKDREHFKDILKKVVKVLFFEN